MPSRCACGRFCRWDAYRGRWWCDRCERSPAEPATSPETRAQLEAAGWDPGKLGRALLRRERRSRPPALDVEALPRRVAHVTHALIEAQSAYAFGQQPLRSGEVVLYDGEALDARQTASALRRARNHGLVACAGRYWFPTFLALEHRRALEERYLRETDEGG
jgi:hypothetical protein